MNTPTKFLISHLFAAVAISFGSVQAAVLLIVDLSVTNQVTVTSTTGTSAINASGDDFIGIYFEDLFGTTTGTGFAGSSLSGNLTSFLNSSDSSPGLFSYSNDSGLNMWAWTNDALPNFTAGVQAFSGSATWAVSAVNYTELLNGNSSGNLYFPADDLTDIAGLTALGTYTVVRGSVVPEPSRALLLALGLGLLFFGRRR